jgi:tRNA pseudouridine synthase 10
MLGKGRPFVMEIVNPRRTLFTPNKIKELKENINKSTELISVRDLQLVEK